MFEPDRLRGIVPPILTPLTPDETVDTASLQRLTTFLLDNGVHGIWVMGTTGEFPCLDEEQRARAVAAVVEAVAGRVPVVANVSDCSTQLAIRHARRAAAAGADALAATPPYYYPHSMDEVVDHFRAIRAAVDRPLLIYNIPQTVKVRMEVGTTVRLAEEGTCVGIKDSQNDLQWFRAVALQTRSRAPQFRLLIGTASLIDAAIQVGGHGAIPGIANVAVRECVAAYEAAARGDFAAAAQAQEAALRYEALGRIADGGSPNAAIFSALKHTLVRWGVIAHPTVARPLRPLTADEQRRLEALLATLPAPAVAV